MTENLLPGYDTSSDTQAASAMPSDLVDLQISRILWALKSRTSVTVGAMTLHAVVNASEEVKSDTRFI